MQTRFIRAILAVVFVAGTASASFYVSRRLSTTAGITPNAPSSNPLAQSEKRDGGRVFSGRDIGNPRERRETMNNEEAARAAALLATPTPTPKPTPTVAVSAAAKPPSNGSFGHVAGPGEYGYGTDMELIVEVMA